MYNRGDIRLFEGCPTETVRPSPQVKERQMLSGGASLECTCLLHRPAINSSTRTGNPVDYTRNCGSSSHHAGGAHFLCVDGNVRFLSNQIDFRTYCYLGDKDDGHQAEVPTE